MPNSAIRKASSRGLVALLLAMALMTLLPAETVAAELQGEASADSLLVAAQSEPISIEDATIGGIQDLEYTGGEVEQPNLTVTLNGIELVQDRDYTVYYTGNTYPGKASVHIDGLGDYEGSLMTTFKILPVSLSGATVKLSSTSYLYDGSAKQPDVTVTLNGRTLVKYNDYKVTYEKNRKPGKAKVTITGVKAYTGTVVASFTIKRLPAMQTSVHIAKGAWTKFRGNGKLAGSKVASKCINAAKIRLANPLYKGVVKYRVRLKGKGWQKWTTDGKVAGSTKKSSRIEAIQVKLTGKMARYYSVDYRVFTQKYGWSGWASNGEPAGTEDLSCGVSGMQVELVKRGYVKTRNAQAYRRHTLPAAIKRLDAASGKATLTTKKVKLTSAQKKTLKAYLKTGNVVGFIAVNVKSGKTIAYNPDDAIFSASTIKAPYIAALCKYDAPGIASRKSDIAKSLLNSNNDTYRNLYESYGESYMRRMANEVGVSFATTSWGYADLSARDLAKLWAFIQDYLNVGTTNRSLFESRLQGSNGNHYKVGLMYPDSWSGGIYAIGGMDGDVVYAIMTTYSGSGAVNIFGLSGVLCSIIRTQTAATSGGIVVSDDIVF